MLTVVDMRALSIGQVPDAIIGISLNDSLHISPGTECLRIP